MTTNEEKFSNLWRGSVRELYQKNARNRSYALTDDSRRHLVQLFQACLDATNNDSPEARKLFEWAVERFADAGINVLQPNPPAEIKVPEMWKDPWGNVLANPFVTGDLKGQTLITQRDAELAKWLKKFATDPLGAYVELQDLQAAAQSARTFTYNSDTHLANPWARSNATVTERSRFEKEHPDLVERLKFEAVPVSFPFGKNFNLTLQTRIGRTPKLAGLFDSMQLREKAHIEQARAASQAKLEEARKSLEELEATRA
jgi:hypothetical protein